MDYVQQRDSNEHARFARTQQRITILFSDIRGFTSISEHFKEDPEGLTTLINRLLGEDSPGTSMTNSIISLSHFGSFPLETLVFFFLLPFWISTNGSILFKKLSVWMRCLASKILITKTPAGLGILNCSAETLSLKVTAILLGKINCCEI